MLDVGLYNFVVKALEDGKSKDDIRATLAHAQWTTVDIEAALQSAEKKNPPETVKYATVLAGTGANTPTPVSPPPQIVKNRPDIITALCGYYFVSWLLMLVNLSIVANTLGLSRSYAAISSLVSLSPENLRQFSVIGILVATVISVIGYWCMRKWGVALYTCCVIGMIFLALSNIKTFTPSIVLTFAASLIVPGAMLLAGFVYRYRMD